MDCHFLLQGIFPTQGSNPGLPHCRQTLYRLSHQGSRWNKRSHCNKKPPLATTREKPIKEWRPSTPPQKINKVNYFLRNQWNQKWVRGQTKVYSTVPFGLYQWQTWKLVASQISLNQMSHTHACTYKGTQTYMHMYMCVHTHNLSLGQLALRTSTSHVPWGQHNFRRQVIDGQWRHRVIPPNQLCPNGMNSSLQCLFRPSEVKIENSQKEFSWWAVKY